MMDAPTWDQALDALEQHLLDAEALVRGDIEEMPADTWVKPYGLGPMPPRLVEGVEGLVPGRCVHHGRHAPAGRGEADRSDGRTERSSSGRGREVESAQ
jgi:hypothetical protein